MRSRGRAGIGALLVAALLLAACGGDDGVEIGSSGGVGSGGGGSTGAAAAETAASVSIINAAVERLVDEEFVDAGEGDPLAEGDEVRTDTTGFAQIDYADGSLARIGPESLLRIVALADTPEGIDSELELDVGRVWSKVETVTESDGRFEIGTPVGVAAVRGTAFDTFCTAADCTFTVLEGIVELELPDGTIIRLEAFQRITVGLDGTVGPVEDFGPEDADADPWLSDNLERDAARPAAGDNLAGDWRVTRTVTAGGGPCEQPVDTIWTIDGDETLYRLVLASDEAAGSNLGASATTASFGFDATGRTVTIEMNDDGTAFAGAEEWADGCEVEVVAVRNA